MELKKINPNLQKALAEHNLVHANELQQETFSTIKSGADCIIAAPDGSGKTTTLVINTIQKLGKPEGESTRALLLVETKEDVLEMVELFAKYATYTGLRFIGVHEKGDIDFDKNQISLGMDIIIGTPEKVNQMFSSAGFNLNTVKFFAVDDADVLFKKRQDSIVLRLSASVAKTQYVFACSQVTERVEIIADKIMTEPLFFESEEDQA
ncbi:DEAD/DEAH box helicase [Flavobacterium silvaticum]|uniref:DEAD/DEAH box helicase n=1 Tax=Flavobacterium silvaticum TaxID=1852020 RepID=A0A972JKP1_9FLAO|nr:DEAD/DEAH box helicase [Flavobacterium silvaticum]NMH29322.1 DEAD/DEAH box helicase [Flavobacterium silvaticum]